jgi:photosystem II stability/assembly factor-like uncharacterized protein
MALTAYVTATPLDSGKFKDIYTSIKEFKSRFKERFELDHYMGGVVDDTDPTCEGYHKQLTMNGGEYNATNIPTTIPACPTGGIVFFSIGGELCCYDGDTAKQITDDGQIAIDDPVNETSGTGQHLYGICYGNGLYVAVGEAGTILVSSDGSSWSSKISGTTQALNKCCYGNGLYVAVGNTNTILVSSDGSSWSSKNPSGATVHFRNCIYDGTQFIAIGSSGALFTSADGNTWSPVSTSFTSQFEDICYGNGLYIIVSIVNSNNAVIITSSDLSTFTQKYSGSALLYSCCYGNGMFIVGGNAVILSSTDGNTWNTAATTRDIRHINYDINTFFAVTYNYGGYILFSNDGVTWRDDISTGLSKYHYCGVAGDNLYIIVAQSGNIVSIPKYITLP